MALAAAWRRACGAQSISTVIPIGHIGPVPRPQAKSPRPDRAGSGDARTRATPSTTTPRLATSMAREPRPAPAPRPMAMRPVNMPATKRLASRVASSLVVPVRAAIMVDPQKTIENSIETAATRKSQAIQ